MKTVLIALIIAVAGLWTLSYFSYPIVANQAYSGASTELFCVDGRLVYFDFDNYSHGAPSRSLGFACFPKKSRMAARISAEFASPSPWGGTLGFTFQADQNNPEYGKLRVMSVPLWLFEVVLMAVLGAVVIVRRSAKVEERHAVVE